MIKKLYFRSQQFNLLSQQFIYYHTIFLGSLINSTEKSSRSTFDQSKVHRIACIQNIDNLKFYCNHYGCLWGGGIVGAPPPPIKNHPPPPPQKKKNYSLYEGSFCYFFLLNGGLFLYVGALFILFLLMGGGGAFLDM